MGDAPGRFGQYPTGEGDITDVGRRQQIAVAAWVLGWLGGPLPAMLVLLVTRPERGTFRRLVTAAVWFWSAVVVAAILLVLVAGRDEVGPLLVGWGVISVVALVVTALAIRRALDRIT